MLSQLDSSDLEFLPLQNAGLLVSEHQIVGFSPKKLTLLYCSSCRTAHTEPGMTYIILLFRSIFWCRASGCDGDSHQQQCSDKHISLPKIHLFLCLNSAFMEGKPFFVSRNLALGTSGTPYQFFVESFFFFFFYFSFAVCGAIPVADPGLVGAVEF